MADKIEVYFPSSGGKAGKGCNRTSSVQVRKNNCIVKQFRFIVSSSESRAKATKKAAAYADTLLEKRNQKRLREIESW